MKSMKLNFILVIIKSIAGCIFPIISFPYATRILGVENIGKVSYCTSIISYVSLIAGLGISIYATREGAKVREDKSKLSKFAKEIITINVVSTVIVYSLFLVLLINDFFKVDKLLLFAVSMSVWCTTLGIEWVYQIMEEYTYITLRTIILQLIAILCLFIFVKDEKDVVIYSIVQVFAVGGAFLVNLIGARKYINLLIITEIEIKKHLKGILLIFAISASSIIYLNLDAIMIRNIYSDYENGLYATAVKIINIVKTVVNSLSMVMISRLSNYLTKKEGDKRYEQLLKKGVTTIITIIIPCACILIVLSEPIIYLISGEKYLGASMSMKILALNLIFSVLNGMMYYQIFVPNKKEKTACIGTMLGAIMNLILNAIFIPLLGIEGAALATMLAEMVVFFVFIKEIKKEFFVIDIFKDVGKILLLSVIIMVICLIWKLASFGVLSTLVGAGVSVSVIYVLGLIILKSDVIKFFLNKRG